MATARRLRAPYPYFGGKSRVADAVWARLGDVQNYIEPFAGSVANLLARPHPPRVETINDLDCYVANFWRAIQQDPEGVAEFADSPVNEADLHARHRWLVGVEFPEPLVPAEYSRHPLLRSAYLAGFKGEFPSYQHAFRRRMRTDPRFYDVRFAGWWCWGLCCWIGGGWCTDHGRTVDGGLKQTLPHVGHAGKGVSKRADVKEQLPTAEKCATGGKGVNGIARAGDVFEQIPGVGRCSTGGRGVHGVGLHRKRPFLGSPGGEDGTGSGSARGVNLPSDGKFPNLGGRSHNDAGKGVNKVIIPAGAIEGGRPQLADAFSRGRGVHGHDQAETCRERREFLLGWFADLADRLRVVRVCCGHWKRVCGSPSVTTRLGLTGVFLDPPYPTHEADGTESRSGTLYASDSAGSDELDKIRDEVLAFCLERGPDPLMRICVAGYDTDGYEALLEHGWEVVAWRAQGGYGNRSSKGQTNAARERLYYSPHCLKPGDDLPLFAGRGQA